MTQILGISGKQGSGKDSVSNFIHALLFPSIAVEVDGQEVPWVDYAYVDEGGKLIVPNSETTEGILDLTNPEVQKTLFEEGVSKVVQRFEPAAIAKRFACDYLGLSWQTLNGSHEDKDSETRYPWLGVIKSGPKMPGFMTHRQILEYFDTWIRGFDESLPINLTLNDVEASETDRAVIVGVRHPSDVEGIHKRGGRVIRLLRNPYKSDTKSENALNKFEGFDAVIDNSELSMQDCHAQVFELLKTWEFIPS
jgi:hypothetical protein